MRRSIMKVEKEGECRLKVNLLYHGRNRKQCRHEPNCVWCWLRFVKNLVVLRLTR